ncbi:MAG: hypothetical protein ACRDC4_17435 [Plesiomonas sp.]
MQACNTVVAMMEGLKAVTVIFNESRGRYTYLSAQDINVDDLVIVNSPRSGMTICKVVDVTDNFDIHANFEYKFIVSKLDTTEYDAIMAAKAELEAQIKAAQEQEQRRLVREHLLGHLAHNSKVTSLLDALNKQVAGGKANA